MTSNVKSREALRGMFRADVREVSAVWWWFLILGIVWTGLGMYVLSYRVGSLATVAALVGGVFLFGGVAQLVVASRIPRRVNPENVWPRAGLTNSRISSEAGALLSRSRTIRTRYFPTAGNS